MSPKTRVVATIVAASLGLAVRAQAVNLSRYRYTLESADPLVEHQLDLQTVRGLCRDDDGCLVILLYKSAYILQTRTGRLLLSQGDARWTTDGSTAYNEDGDQLVSTVLEASTGTPGERCYVSDLEEGDNDDTAPGFSLRLSNPVPTMVKCEVTFID